MSDFLKLACADWRQREYILIAVAVAIAVAVVTAISAVSERVESAIQQNAAELLGGDLVLQTSRPMLSDLGLTISNVRQADSAELATMISTQDNFVLVSLKSVSENYPLYGNVFLLENNQDSQRIAPPISKGEAWVEPKLLSQLGIEVGDDIMLGMKTLRITGLIASEPDKGADFYSFAPRVLISSHDLEATELIAPGSRVKYRYYFTGKQSNLDQVKEAVSPKLTSHERWLDIRTSRPALGNTIERAEKYLLSAIVLIWGLAGLALFLSGERFYRQHFQYSAWLRCLGVGSARMLQFYTLKLFVVCMVGALLGCALGFILQLGVGYWLDRWLVMELPGANVLTFIVGPIAAVLLMCGFVLPKMYQLAKIPPNTVIRAPESIGNRQYVLAFFSAVVALAAFALLLLPDVKIALGLAIIIPIVFVVLLVVTRYILFFVATILPSPTPVIKVALLTLKRQPWLSSLQCVGFIISFTALSTAYLIRTDMISEWQASIPEDAPNHFVINVLPTMADEMTEYLHDNKVQETGLYPVVRGRLTHIQGKDVSNATDDVTEEVRDESLRRELNLTWAKELPENNEIEEGDFWEGNVVGERWVSVEAGLAKRLELSLGDELSFQVGSQTFSAKVTSFRSVEWASFQPNFYFIFPPQTINEFAHTFMTSFYLPNGNEEILNQMIRKFPSISLLPVGDIISQVKKIITQVGYIVEVLMVCVLITSLLILASATILTREQRDNLTQIMRTFGASKSILKNVVQVEFLLLGVLSGLLAIMLTEVTLAVLYTKLFDMQPAVHWLPMTVVLFSAIVLVGLSGRLAVATSFKLR